MKKCIDCCRSKSFDNFNKRRNGYQSRCRECDNAKNRKWYQENKVKALKRAKRNNTRYAKENRKWICEYLLCHPCVDCGETNIIVLQFDHHEDNKFANVGNLICRNQVSQEKLHQEVMKCEVVCANRHILRTAQRAQTYRWVFTHA